MKESIIRKTYLRLMHVFPFLRVTLIRWLYNKLALKNKSKQFVFLNYGYHDETPLNLRPQDEPNRYFIQLYQRVVRDIDLQNKDVVEVGCGQGAGGVFYWSINSFIPILVLTCLKKPLKYVSVTLNGLMPNGFKDVQMPPPARP